MAQLEVHRRGAVRLPLALALALAVAPSAAAVPSIEVLSNRADLVSGGDALVRVGLPEGVDPERVRVTIGRRDVTSAFAVRPSGRFEGLVTDLRVGRNVLRARMPGPDTRIVITNHPNGGPVLSGPQVQPWVCQASAVDEQCNQPPSHDFLYRSSRDGRLRPYDPDDPPSDVATTVTDEGHEAPFVIRIETGYQNRDQYKIAVLYDPAQPWEPWAPQQQWNGKLLITNGSSCGIARHAGRAPSVTHDRGGGESPTVALGRGFAVMSTALNNAGHNCNIATQAESLVMAKERLIEQYGPVRYTIGTGCSGGSLTQQQVANAYPGIYQGLLPQCSFPDFWSTGQQMAAYHLLRRYFEDPRKWGPGLVWTPEDIAAVEGQPNHASAIAFDSTYWSELFVPDDGCAGVTPEQTYDPQTNVAGVRCTLADYMINVLGPRPTSRWSRVEEHLARGFAGLPLSGVGVQFGLEALRRGEITPAQFVDLNARIGGVDIDIRPIPERNDADRPALAHAYRTGAINTASNLDRVAIIDLRGPDHGGFHDAFRSWAIRARLEREHGHAANHVIWLGHWPLVGDPGYPTKGLLAMDRWLAAIERDRSKRPRAEKVVANRPQDIQDRCSQIPAVERVVVPGLGQVCRLRDVESRYATPAMVAGEGVETDINRCRLKPLRRTDHAPVAFTERQWEALRAAFPDGVCDWSQPGVDMQDTIPWQTYQDARGGVIYGGRPLGKAPTSKVVRQRRGDRRRGDRRRG